jgi:hypothetical protein
MKTTLGALVILAATMAGHPATADSTDHSANYYLPGCRDFANKQFAKEPFLQGECVGILEGSSILSGDLAPVFVYNSSCVPDEVTLSQMAAVVVRWFDQHPERWHEDFRALALLALHDAWPCK